MRKRSSPILGLVIADNEIVCAQVASTGASSSSPSVQKLGRFALDASPLAKPTETGAALAAFLRQHGFTASNAVVGVPTRWLLSQEKELPPSGREEALAILRLQAERLVMADNTTTVVDFAGETSATQPARVLLVAMLRSQLDGLTAMASAAGLDVVGVTSTSLATARLLNAASDRPLVLLGDKGAEVVAVRDGAPRSLRHVPLTVRGTAGVAGAAVELRRAITMSGGASAGLMLWDGVGLTTSERADLSERLKFGVLDHPSMTDLGAALDKAALNGASAGRAAESYLPAIALAVSGTDRRRLPLDFANPRLAAPVVSRFGRRTVWITLFAALAVVGLATLYTTVQQRESQAFDIDTQLKGLEKDVKSAESTLERVSYGRTYFETRPLHLECLREVTLAFDYDEPIWTTSFNYRDNRKGTIRGKTTNENLILTVLDRLRANRKFANVQLNDSRAVGGRSAEWSFTISFTFVAVE